MIIFLRMLIAHIVADFSLQSDESVACRKEKGWHSRSLYTHAFIYATLVAVVTLAWDNSWKHFAFVFIILFASHLLIDGFKVKFTDKLPSFLIDQCLHIIILIAISAYLSPVGFEPFINPLKAAFTSEKILVILLGFLIILWPTGVLISHLIRPFKDGITENEEHNGLDRAGLWIGLLERFLTYGFVIAGYPQAISLLVAGKGVFRFGEIKDGNRAEVEYILIGSLFSFTSALVVGQLVKMFIGQAP